MSSTSKKRVTFNRQYHESYLKYDFVETGICTDGAAATTGRLSGLTARIKEVASESESTHCLIHREVLGSRKNVTGI
ncbi:hypothetical protein TNIN_487501 [Trichonephila inaurata madagascariensis]|uniref:Uncharacterized protein n=1 Tax=Trichonephila inaurata madagascariensis TaxID=2747483 RepID=A0A8X6Y222_9ARAC|nr:hypothetical protein TNIN_487501 [Trichonephila inaurata madagascariensis]